MLRRCFASLNRYFKGIHMLCPNCGRHNVSTVEVCGACGTALPVSTAPSRPVEFVPPQEASPSPAPAVHLEKTSVPLIMLLSLVTLGVYYPVWFITRLERLNALNSGVKLKKGSFVVVIVLFALSIAAAFASIGLEGKSNADAVNAIDLASRLLNLAGGIILLVEAFRVKKMLSEHFNAKLSGIATFFFNVLYLQYKINRL